jgi:hypothetical protein
MRGGLLPSQNGRSINANGGVTGLIIRNNLIEGSVWGGSSATITGNTIWGDGWLAIAIGENNIVTGNRAYADFDPFMTQGAAGSLVERNYGTKLDGSAVQVPISTTCPATATCVGNWTVGQVPPP